ncbi:MAG: CDGSH iron-sulfur domain-containing protein [Acidimicrobiales bacterium]
MTTAPKAGFSVEVTEGGPYVIDGTAVVRSATPVVSERGEPMTWRYGAPEVVEGAALCRCGASDDKPFCDGSHAEVDWDAACTPPEGSSAERARTKTGTGLTLVDDDVLCMHAGFCGTERTSVWRMMGDTADTEVRATVIRMVEKCPSGRLANRIDDTIVEPSLPAEIGVVPDGPLWLTGGIDVDGVETRNRMTLCRCGASSTKPLCDGSHVDIDFSAPAPTDETEDSP